MCFESLRSFKLPGFHSLWFIGKSLSLGPPAKISRLPCCVGSEHRTDFDGLYINKCEKAGWSRPRRIKERAARLRCEVRLTRVDQSMATLSGEHREAWQASEFIPLPCGCR
jgi:hypothetical protein